MFVFNRDAVRELRRQLARVVALLSEDKERVVRLVSYIRRGRATIGGGGGGASSLSVKNEGGGNERDDVEQQHGQRQQQVVGD